MTLSSQVSSLSSQVSSQASSQAAATSSQISQLSSQIASSAASQASSQASATSSQIGRVSTQVQTIDDFVITPGEAAANPAAQAASPEQRLRIFVPRVKTVLAMGAPSNTGSSGGTRQEDTGEPTYGGFNVGTDGNIFMTALGSSTYQSQGHIGIHSYGTAEGDGVGSIFVGANKKIGIAAKEKNITINGGGGVLIAGGQVWPSAARTEPLPEYSVEVPAWLPSAMSTTDMIGKFWSVADAACAAYGIAQTVFEDQIDAESSKASKVFGWISLGTSILNIIGNVAGIFDAEPFGGTTIHGNSGMIIGTGGTMGLYSVLGSGMASATSCQVLAPTVSVSGIVDATLTSKGGTGVYGKNVQLISRQGTLLTSRQGHTVIGGSAIEVGHRNSVGKQVATDGVSIHGTYSVEIGADAGAGYIQLAAGGLDLRGKGEIHLTSSATMIGAKESMLIDSKKVSIGAVDDVTIGAGEAVVKLTKSEASIGFGVPPDLDSKVSEIEKQIGEVEADVKKWSKVFDGAHKKPRNQNKIRMEAAKNKAAAEKRGKALKADLTKLKQKANAIKFKDGGIEIIFQGNKMKIDGSKVESGPIKWMK